MGTFAATSVKLTEINCGLCGGTYAINERYRLQAERDGSSWYCPYCKCSWGYSEGENARLKRQIKEKEAQIKREQVRTETAKTEARHQRNIARAERGAKTKLKKRVAHGVCPCCNRTFKQLKAHMLRKHPEYVEEHNEKAS